MFLAFLGAFHGRTQGALSLTASKAKQRAGFFPTMPGVVHVPYAYCYRCPYKLTYPSCDLYCANIIEDVYMKTVAPPEDTAGIFVEPVQGEGGYIVPPPGWMDRIAKIGEHLARRLDEMTERYEFIGDRRGLGMMQATEFVTDKRSKKPDPKRRDAIEKDAYQHGLILLPCGDSAMRYIPALNIPRDVLDAGLDVLEECFKRAAT